MTTIDGELFNTLEEAVEFVASCGGGIVYSPAAGTFYAQGLVNQYPTVTIKPKREGE
jgi:hypothetical protein